MANKNAATASSENSILARTVIISCLILTAIFISVLFLQDNFEGYFGKYADEVVTGLMLVALWLVVSSTIRSVNNLAKNIPTWKLLSGGVLTALISSVLTVAFLLLFPNVARSQNMQEVTGASGGIIALMTIISFIISLISIVNIRVKNRRLGNLLEFLIIGGSILVFVYFASK